MPLLSCSLGLWFSSPLLSALLWTTTHFSAGYNSLINTVPSLHVCGGVKMGRFHIHFCSFPLFSCVVVPDFTEGSRQLHGITTKRRSLKLCSQVDCPFNSRTGPSPRKLHPSEEDTQGTLPNIPRS